MKMRLPFSVFLFIASLSFHFFSFAQEIHFNVVPRSQDDAGSIITGMTQDTQGFLWLSTQFGLYKYDGYQYSSYHNEPSNPNSLAADNIQFVAADKAGYIWLGMSESGLDRLDPATGIFTHFRHNDNDSELWVGLTGWIAIQINLYTTGILQTIRHLLAAMLL